MDTDMIEAISEIDEDKLELPDEIAHTVRSSDQETIRKHARIKKVMEKGTNYDKYSKSGAWIFALNLANRYLEEYQEGIENIETEFEEAVP